MNLIKLCLHIYSQVPILGILITLPSKTEIFPMCLPVALFLASHGMHVKYLHKMK